MKKKLNEKSLKGECLKIMENENLQTEKLDVSNIDGMKIEIVKNSIRFIVDDDTVYFKNLENFLKVLTVALNSGKRSIFTFAPRSLK